MGEAVNDGNIEYFLPFFEDKEFFDGVSYLEFICTSFFGETFICPEGIRGSSAVKSYSLFYRDFSFRYGQA